MERVDRPEEGARRRSERLRPELKEYLAPFADQPQYAGIEAAERRFAADLGPRLLVFLGVLFYAIYFGQASFERFAAFQQPGFDIGIFDQGIWLLSRFKDPFVTIMGLDLFGDHASYILLFFVPLYWVWPSAHWLLISQTLALAVAAIPVYLLAKHYLRNAWLAVLPAAGFLLAPALGWLNLENFHPDSFEVPLTLFALYFVSQRRWRPYLVMIVLLLLVKEDVAFLVVPLGIYVGLRHDRRVGFVTASLGIIWFIVTVFFLGPIFSGGGAGSLDAFRVPFGGWKGLLSTALTEPWKALGYMLTSDKIKYLVQLLAPVLFLPLFAAETLVVLPSILFNLLSTFSYQTNIRYHYTSLLIPVLAWSALLFARRVRDSGARRALVVMMLGATLFSAYVWGPADWARDAPVRYDPDHAEVQALREAVAMIPDDAVVACRSRISTHLSHREKVYDFPTPFYATYYGDTSMDRQRLPEADEVEYVIDIPSRLSEVGLRIFSSLQENEGFEVIFAKEGVVMLKKPGPISN